MDMYRLPIIFIASIIVGFAYNNFLLPHSILSGGVAGIAMMLGIITPINSGIIMFALNIPIFIMGYIYLGRRFIIYSVFSVTVTSITMQLLPIHSVVSDSLLASVFGGVIAGVSIGVIFKVGGSTGGFDIIGMIITKKRDLSLGNFFFTMNAIIIFFAGFLFEWDLALYTLLSIFATSRVIDAIHTQHVKLTLMIISSKGEEIRDQLLAKLYRGITVMDGEGAYSKEPRKVLFTVITRYELSEVKAIVKATDPKAFVNITQTVEVMGFFVRK